MGAEDLGAQNLLAEGGQDGDSVPENGSQHHHVHCFSDVWVSRPVYFLPYSGAELLLPTVIQVVLLMTGISVQPFLLFLTWGVKMSAAFTAFCTATDWLDTAAG